jgi:hypothetical protein
MPMATEPERQGVPIKTTNEPVGPKNAGSPGSVGDVALKDAIALIVVCWLIVFFFTFSLRRFNV